MIFLIWFGFMVFNATFNNISVIYRGGQFYSWRKPEYPENTTELSQVTDKLYHIMLYTLPWSRFKLTTSVVIGTDGTIFKHYICLKAYCLPNGKIVIFSYPKLLLFSILTFIEWRLTPSYAAKDTIFWQKKPPILSLSELLSRITRIHIYSYDLLC